MKIDRLPPAVHEAIILLRNGKGKTWVEIEALSHEPQDKGGFIDWDSLDTHVLELFPDLRLPKSSLHLWYKQRVELVREQTLQRSSAARELASAFAGAELKGDRDATINAMRDVIFGLMSDADDEGTRSYLVKSLGRLADVQQQARLNDLREGKLTVERRKIKLLEEREKLAIRKLEAETDKLAKKASSGQPITAEDLADIRKKTFGF